MLKNFHEILLNSHWSLASSHSFSFACSLLFVSISCWSFWAFFLYNSLSSAWRVVTALAWWLGELKISPHSTWTPLWKLKFAHSLLPSFRNRLFCAVRAITLSTSSESTIKSVENFIISTICVIVRVWIQTYMQWTMTDSLKFACADFADDPKSQFGKLIPPSLTACLLLWHLLKI